MISFKGTVTRFIFDSNNNDSFCILELDDNSRKVIVKGYLPCVHYGFYLTGSGDVQEGEHNDTIIVKNVEIKLPNDLSSISNYCSSLIGFDEKQLSENVENRYDDEEVFEEIRALTHADNMLDELCEGLGTSILDQIENQSNTV